LATSRGELASRASVPLFTPAAYALEASSPFFHLDGKHLWYGVFDGQPRLAQAPLDGGPTAQVKLPPLTQDAVGYIAQNPVARSEYAIATFGRSVYLSKDAGRTWTAIAERGQSK